MPSSDKEPIELSQAEISFARAIVLISTLIEGEFSMLISPQVRARVSLCVCVCVCVCVKPIEFSLSLKRENMEATFSSSCVRKAMNAAGIFWAE